jgi:hypothetical protein
MSTAAEFRKYAIEAMEAARKAQTENEQAQFLDLAEIWLRAATTQAGKPALPPFEAFIGKAAGL